MISKNNIYLIHLLLTLMGIVLFLINIKELFVYPGLLFLSIFLMIIPALNYVINIDSFKTTKVQSFILVLFPLIFLQYIYYIKMGVPVGFTDVHAHIIQHIHLFSNEGNILFSESRQLSFNFVNLYVIFRFLEYMCNLDIVFLASFIPPIFTLINIVLVYLIINKIHSHHIALLTMMLFGWENQTLIFGHEMRTQTLGVLILLLILFTQFSNIKKSISISVVLIILFFSAAATAFSTFFYTFILVLFLLILYTVVPMLIKSNFQPSLITWKTFSLFLLFFSFYVMFISDGFQSIFSSIITLFNEMMSNTDAAQVDVSKTGQLIYGNFVKYSNYLFWGVFILASLIYIKDSIKSKNLVSLIFFFSFGFLFLYMIFNTFFGVLSAGRIYSVVFILMATVVAFALVKLVSIQQNKSKIKIAKITVCIVLLIVVSSSIVKLPNYIVGSTDPLRSNEFIDDVPYWSADLPQYSSSRFISSFAMNQSLDAQVLVSNYFTKQIQLIDRNKNTNELRLLQDKFQGKKHYSYRNKLPEYDTYNNTNNNQIYSNGDYILFQKN